MKKKRILSLLIIFALIFTAVPMTAFAEDPGVNIANAFPDSILRDHVKLVFDKNKDGYLSDAEIANATSIYAYDKGIQSMEGIEYLPNLELLSIGNNQLTTLDVSNNTNLGYLDCYGNQLTSLDVSQNTALTILACGGNKLTSLDVRKNTLLEGLLCENGQLTSLNLGNNLELTSVICDNNNLTTLDLVNNTKLKALSCKNNKLTKLYLGAGKALITVDCSNNDLTSLTVSDKDALQELKCARNKMTSLYLSYNTALKTLDCNYNQLTALDLSNNLAITDLSCDNNKLTTLNLIKNENLKNVSCNYNELDNLYFGSGNALKTLDCSDNKLTRLNLGEQTKLNNLNCANNKLTELLVLRNINLFEVDCSNNQLTELEMQANLLEKLDCRSNKFTTLNLLGRRCLTYLNCGDNQLTQLDLSENTALKTLYCSNNKITSLNLGSNTALESLGCEDNQLTTLDVSQNTALTSIHCPNNKLTSLDVSKNTALKFLYCENNKLTALDVRNIPELEELYCQNNQLTSLQLNRYLVWLDCSGNKLTSLDLSNVSYLSYMNISPKLDMVKSSNGDLSVNLGQLEDYITFSSETSLANATGISGYFAKDANSFYEGNDYEPTFDRNTLTATWTKDQLGENRYCFDVEFGVVGVARLRFEVNQETILPAPVVTKGNDPVTGKPKLTWKAVSGAAKYEVYRYDSVKKVYVKMYTTTGTTYTNTLSSEAGKTYYYKVKAIGSSSSMTPSITGPITITCKYPTPVVKGTNDPVTGRNVLNWKKVDGATKYEVYRYDKVKKVYVKMYTTTGTTYTNTIATVGETYFYKVKALGPVAAATSAFSKQVTLTYKCATPVLTGSNDASTGKPKVSWGKIDGATKYEVYRYDKVKKVYVKMYTTTGTTYTNTIATVGETYFYKVKALGPVAAATSAFSKPVTLTYKYATPVVTGSNDASTGKPKLTWRAVPGATKYEVYRYDSVKKDYVRYFITTSTEFVNSSTQAGSVYYYKVKAVGTASDAASKLSSPVRLTCKCAAPKVTGSNSSTGKPKLTWGKVEGATKYEVYRYDSVKKDYVRYYITTSTEFVNSSTQAGSVYYYKVKAIGATSESNSAMSSPVRIVCQ